MPVTFIDEQPVIKVNAFEHAETMDLLAAEEPLEIKLEYGDAGSRLVKTISVTMRTPGNDAELAVGFLFTEGIIRDVEDIKSVHHVFMACAEDRENVIQVSLREGVAPNLSTTERNFYTTSSCGVCGKSSIDAIHTVSNYNADSTEEEDKKVEAGVLYKMPEVLQQYQEIFEQTGGLHASAMFSTNGGFLLVREDVGRHNALDKLIGAALSKNWLPLRGQVLLLSGRASFELIQKSAMAGIRIIAAVGAPSSLAVQTAKSFGITLAGFLRGKRFNIYTSPHRIVLD